MVPPLWPAARRRPFFFATSGLRCFAFILAIGLVLAGCGGEPDRARSPIDPIDAFLTRHWVDPLPPQGNPPDGFAALEASLAPDDCGGCHAEQYAQWRASLHSHTMSDGIAWQLALMDQGQGNKCLRCHAPLAEQKALVALRHGWPNAPTSAPPSYVPADLADQGLVCAACHVRAHQRFGPPARTERAPVDAPHGGFQPEAAFEDSRFCAFCHQFPETGPRVNGKLQEDTYTQWLASPHASEQTCQSCHMPERRHEFRGIHDPEMVRRALRLALDVDRVASDRVAARLRVSNTGAGHHFPTYMVPKVTVVFSLVNPQTGAVLDVGRQVIGWQVDVALTQELFDTRIPAGAQRLMTQEFDLSPDMKDWEVEVRLEVAPKEHYERMFTESLAQADRLPDAVVTKLRAALNQARAARFEALRLRAKIPETSIAN